MIQALATELITAVRRSGLRAPQRILFGSGEVSRLGEAARALAREGTALVITGRRSARQSGLADQVSRRLEDAGIAASFYAGVDGEPNVEMVDNASEQARRISPALVIGVGGGSVLDCAKAVAAMATNTGSVRDYLEGVGTGRKIETSPLPLLAVPTVAGTGAEMTRNSVIGVPDQGVKRSLRHDDIMPAASLVDPELTVGVPFSVTAAGSLDTLTQLIESCISVKRRPETTYLAHEGLRLLRQPLLRCPEGLDLQAREGLALASMLSGTCLANAGLALVHGIASGIGEYKKIPHGLVCGILLPHALRFNRPACRKELADALACFLNEEAPDEDLIIDRGIGEIEHLNHLLQIPPDLKHLKISTEEVNVIARQSMGSSMSGNPIPMTDESTAAFLRPLVYAGGLRIAPQRIRFEW
jgi:alcohol dehydrogenase class IV